MTTRQNFPLLKMPQVISKSVNRIKLNDSEYANDMDNGECFVKLDDFEQFLRLDKKTSKCYRSTFQRNAPEEEQELTENQQNKIKQLLMLMVLEK